MTISTYGRSVTAIAILFLIVLFSVTRAHADTVWAGDISISNVNGKPTATGADIAHVSLVMSHTGVEPDVLIAVDVDPAIANAATSNVNCKAEANPSLNNGQNCWAFNLAYL